MIPQRRQLMLYHSIMATRRVERGPVNERVARNIKALRERRGWTLQELSDRLTALGRPILATGIKKIEHGGELGRRVDVDDLVGLALALQVTPSTLLVGLDGGEEQIALTGTVSATSRQAWEWATSVAPRVIENLDVDFDRWQFAAECRPHRQRLTPERSHQIRRALEPAFDALDQAHDAGISVDELENMLDLYLRVEREHETERGV